MRFESEFVNNHKQYEKTEEKEMIVKNFSKTVGEKANVMNIITDEGRAFYVRFYVEELEIEFLDIVEMYRRMNLKREITLSCINGTYMVTEKMVEGDGVTVPTPWDILMHKYFMISKEIRKDTYTGEKYHPIRFSKEYINPSLKRMTAV